MHYRRHYYYLSTGFLIILLSILACQEVRENPSTANFIPPSPSNGGISLPENFGAVVVAEKLGEGRARHVVVRENGDIHINLRKLTGEDFGNLVLRDSSGDGVADLIQGYTNSRGTGMAIHKGFLYFSSDKQVYRTPLPEDSMVPIGPIDTLVTIPHEGGHMAKSITFDQEGNMYVNVGSLSNACQEQIRSKESKGIDPCVELETRAGVWRFKDDLTGQTQEDGIRYATGIRNAVALEWNDEINSLYALQHGRDDLHRFWPAYFTEEQNVELPAEEFLQIDEGDDFGWPYCFYNQIEGQKLLNPEYGGDGEEVGRCEDAKLPIMGFPGHWAPNDLLFYAGDMFPEKYKNGAFIAFHGSWNRLNANQAGYKVVFVPMKEGKASGDYEVFADQFIGTQPISSPGDAKFRPCGLAQGPDGSLYITDSQLGRVWRVIYYPEGTPEVEELASEEHTEATDQAENVAMINGKSVYEANCQACHMESGKGVPGMNPPLVATDWVTGDKERLINVIINGLQEPIEVDGETYQNIMAPHNFLSDEQIASVLTYIRKSFGNNASGITVEEVAEIRAKSKKDKA